MLRQQHKGAGGGLSNTQTNPNYSIKGTLGRRLNRQTPKEGVSHRGCMQPLMLPEQPTTSTYTQERHTTRPGQPSSCSAAHEVLLAVCLQLLHLLLQIVHLLLQLVNLLLQHLTHAPVAAGVALCCRSLCPSSG